MLGAVVEVSGQRLAGCGAVGLLLRSVPPSSLQLEVARAPLPYCTAGGLWVGGHGSPWGGVPRHCPLSPPPCPSPGPTGRGRYRLRRLCGSWCCSGGGFCRR